jgi:hypothetical protein
MTSQLQVLDVAVNKPFKDRLHHLYGEWLLSRNCPLTPAGNIRPSEALLGMTFHHIPSSRGLKSAVYQTIQMEQKMMYSGRKIMKKTLLLVMKVVTLIS